MFADNKIDPSHDPKCTILQLPFFVKQSQTITEPPPCLTVGTVHLGSNPSYRLLHTIIRLLDPNKSNFDSCDQTTVSQKSNGFRSISFAYLSRLRRLILFTYGFFRATRQNNFTSCVRRGSRTTDYGITYHGQLILNN